MSHRTRAEDHPRSGAAETPVASAHRPPTSIEEILEHVAHYVPEQAPLHTFVHHNTLHAFEDQPFEEAVIEAARLFGAQPFPTERAFAAHLASGRILAIDIDSVLDDTLGHDGSAELQVVGELTRREYRQARLRQLFEIPRGAALRWMLAETQLLDVVPTAADASRRRMVAAWAERRCAGAPAGRRLASYLRLLWNLLLDNAPRRVNPPALRGVRRRDQLLLCGAGDVDQRVHPLLIRLSASFLDQGVALWPMPLRERGFLGAVRAIYARRFPAPDTWSRGLAEELRRQEVAEESAEQTILRALEALGVPPERRHDFIRDTLLSLPGWAGMMRQFELRPDRAPVQPRPARLIDFLAVQLTLDSFAARDELQRHFGPGASWADLERARPTEQAEPERSLVYEAYMMALIASVDLEQLEEEGVARRWLEEVRAFGELERRRCLHLAYERRLRVTLLDGLANHARQPLAESPPAELMVVFCIDERECSTRRALEESYPQARTYGFAGFFGVAMAWQGLGEVRPRPLCPVNLTPKHYVTERALHPHEESAYLATRRRRGLLSASVGTASREAARGGLLSAFLGVFSVVPMIGRCLFPRLAEHARRAMLQRHLREPLTRLVLERSGDERNEDGLYVGYSVREMADVVENALRTIALTEAFSEIVLIVGHGSSSLNNPHGSAYDCGATGGGRGGPNARAFAAMANHPRVRDILSERGIRIPTTTWFVGALHNTCDDSMVYYDEDLMPDERLPALESAKQRMEVACALEAHERCRRFESAPRTNDIERALRHVQSRSMDLAQPRPECGHATNAFAIVARRALTRGLFLDRRAFLVSYDSTTDPDGAILARVLGAVVPVGAGINLEYYFSFVDPKAYGCGTKLPHNICGLIGVMDGHSSDLRTGLPWQMVEIHEPVRLLAVIEAEPGVVAGVVARDPVISRLVGNGWIQAVVRSPSTGVLWEHVRGEFREYKPESKLLPQVSSSAEFYGGQIESLGIARIATSPSLATATSRGRSRGGAA